MISKLRIKNFALIVEHEIYFNNGLNVISGETGSGKSMILNALKFVLGGRSDKSFIRNGESTMRVEVCFDNIKSNIKDCLNDFGVEYDEGQLIIVRTLNIEGKSDIRINGCNVTVSMLKQVTSMLVDIYGQFDNHSLLSVKNHIGIIDNFDKVEIDQIKLDLKNLINQLKDINEQLSFNFGSEEDKLREIDLLSYQIKELEESNVKDCDELDLINIKSKMLSAEKIVNQFDQVVKILNYGCNNSSIANGIKVCNQAIKSIEDLDEQYKNINERLYSIKFELEDLLQEVNQVSDNLVYDQKELDQVEERLDLIKSIKRKYGETDSKRLEYLNTIKDKLDFIINNEKVVSKLKKDKDNLLKDIFACCKKLNLARHKISDKLIKSINNELEDLGFKGAKFDVLFEREELIFNDYEHVEDNLTLNGLDYIEFIFSANSGEPLKSLNKIISGGEMSRFMLAYKNVVAQKDNIDTLIFDEIDTGISGVIGQQVANKLANISVSHQILSISHLSQIVAMADHNYLVSKNVESDKTFSVINKLNEEEVCLEICRVSGQIENSELAFLHAKELRTNAIKYKTQM